MSSPIPAPSIVTPWHLWLVGVLAFRFAPASRPLAVEDA